MATSDTNPRVVHGRTALQDVWRQRLLALPSGQAGPAELLLCDAAFEGWPLDEPAVLQALTDWLRPAGRHLQIVAQDFAAVQRQHARLSRWRREWAHKITALQPLEPAAGLVPVHWLDRQQALAWLDRDHWRARLLTEPLALQQARLQIDVLLQRCAPAWPVHVVGL